MLKLKKLIVFWAISIFSSSTVSCGHLPLDIHPNPANSGYHRMEFDVVNTGILKKEIGIGNINLDEDQSLEKESFTFYGVYQGTLYLKSNSCGINLAVPFNGTKTFKLKDLIPKPIKCSLDLIAETSPINRKEHNIVETGKIKINVIAKDKKTLTFEYSRANSMKAYFKNYSFIGQGSLQRQEGDLTSSEEFTVKTGLNSGGIYRVAGCSDTQTYDGTFAKSDFKVKLLDIYKKRYLNREDTCDLEILVLPNETPQSLTGRFSLSIFDKNAVMLENLSYNIKKIARYWLEVSGQKYILVCSINEESKIDNMCKTQYFSEKTYWIRAITSNGRKSVYALKNKEVIWSE